MSILQEQLFEFRIDVKVLHIVVVVILLFLYHWAKNMYKEYMTPTTASWLATNPVTGTCMSHTGSNQGCGSGGAGDEGALMNLTSLANSEKFLGRSYGPEFGPTDNEDYLKERLDAASAALGEQNIIDDIAKAKAASTNQASNAQARSAIQAATAAAASKLEYATNKDDALMFSMMGA